MIDKSFKCSFGFVDFVRAIVLFSVIFAVYLAGVGYLIVSDSQNFTLIISFVLGGLMVMIFAPIIVFHGEKSYTISEKGIQEKVRRSHPLCLVRSVDRYIPWDQIANWIQDVDFLANPSGMPRVRVFARSEEIRIPLKAGKLEAGSETITFEEVLSRFEYYFDAYRIEHGIAEIANAKRRAVGVVALVLALPLALGVLTFCLLTNQWPVTLIFPAFLGSLLLLRAAQRYVKKR